MTELNVDGLLASYISLKETICADGKRVDTMAMVHVCTLDGKEGVAGLATDGVNPVQVLPIAVLEMREQLGELDWVAFLSDAHVKKGRVADNTPIPVRGQLARDYEAGVDETISEALVASWATADGRTGVTTVTYHFEDDKPVFDTPDARWKDAPDDTAGGMDGYRGDIPAALSLAFAPLDQLRGS